jgi:hypothetical protein
MRMELYTIEHVHSKGTPTQKAEGANAGRRDLDYAKKTLARLEAYNATR